jgi:glycogen(starch) synthase
MQEFAPDVVHVQCVSANAWYASCVASELGVPLVVSLQGERTMDAQRIYERSPVMNRVLLGALRSATWVTACSGATLRDAARFAPGAFSPNRARVVFNGIGREAFEPCKVFGWPRPYIFALGRLVPQKGFDVLVQAFAQAGKNLPDLLIAGEGPEGAKLERLIADLGLSGRVALLGRADRASVHALMGQSIGVVVPSLREPMGIVVLEALAAGKPLVASRVDGIPEILPEFKTVRLENPGDSKGFADALHWLSGLKGLAPIAEHVAHARLFCWDQIAERYLGMYRGHGAPPGAHERPGFQPESNQEE